MSHATYLRDSEIKLHVMSFYILHFTIIKKNHSVLCFADIFESGSVWSITFGYLPRACMLHVGYWKGLLQKQREDKHLTCKHIQRADCHFSSKNHYNGWLNSKQTRLPSTRSSTFSCPSEIWPQSHGRLILSLCWGKNSAIQMNNQCFLLLHFTVLQVLFTTNINGHSVTMIILQRSIYPNIKLIWTANHHFSNYMT